MPILLYAVEACPLLARQIQSIEFTLTRIFYEALSHMITEYDVNE